MGDSYLTTWSEFFICVAIVTAGIKLIPQSIYNAGSSNASDLHRYLCIWEEEIISMFQGWQQLRSTSNKESECFHRHLAWWEWGSEWWSRFCPLLGRHARRWWPSRCTCSQESLDGQALPLGQQRPEGEEGGVSRTAGTLITKGC